MNPERWAQIEQLYHAALERAPGERTAFLNEACVGDERLRRQVIALLDCDDPAAGFIESPALEFAARLITPVEEDFRGTEKFLIERRLGKGGFGVVYQAYDRERKTVVALKTLRQVDAASLYRFKREFRELANITHQNLVSLYELLSDGEQWFFTMELVNGVDFLKYVWCKPDHVNSASDLSAAATRSIGNERFSSGSGARDDQDLAVLTPPQLDRLREAVRQLAEGLYALHEAGKLHRDVKPSNVLVTHEGRVVLLDFGLVTDLNPQLLRPDTERQIVGTPAYMAPEQGAGLEVSEASDWYSLGVMLYEALTGRLPFSGSFRQMSLDKQTSEPLAPSALAPAIPQDLDELCQSLLHRNPRGRPSGRKVLSQLKSPLARRSVPLPTQGPTEYEAPFLGRASHLTALSEAFQSAKEGQIVLVCLHGSSGMGKSALVRHFLEELQRREEFVALRGRCYEQESVPYKAFDSIVDDLSQYLKSLPFREADALIPTGIRALTQVFPILSELAVAAVAWQADIEVLNSHERRNRAFTALKELLARLALRKPLVLFVDDLQWGDADSASLLIELLYSPNPPALLLIAAYRSEEAETSPFLKKILSLRAAVNLPFQLTDLVVDRLDPAEARELALTLLNRQGQVKVSHAEAIARESGGNPFFIHELAQYSQFSPRQMHVADTAERQMDLLPTGELRLDNLIRARISSLPEEARRFLEVVAVAGQPLRIEVAKQASDLIAGEQAALAILRSGHMIRSRETDEQDEIETYHDRIRETVVESISPEALKRRHHHLAVALESSWRPDPETLAIHFRGAEEYEKASAYAVIAAIQASDSLAFDRAARLYRLALELGQLPLAEARSLLAKLGAALANAGRGAEASKAYLTAAEGVGAAESVELQRRAAEQLLISGHMDEGLSVIGNVLRAVGMKLTPTAWRALLSLLFLRARIRLRGLRYRTREAMQIPPEELIRLDACWSVTRGLSMVDTIRAAEYQARHLLLALQSGEEYRIARALAVEAGYYALAGGRNRSRSQELLRTARALSESINHPHAIVLTTLVTGMAAFLEGRWRESGELLEQAEGTLREKCTGVAWELATARLMWCVSLFFLGELGELGRRLPNLLKNADERGDRYESTDLRIRISHAGLLAADDPGKARQEVRQALKQWSPTKFYLQHWWGLIAEVEICLYSGRSREAWDTITGRWRAIRMSFLMRVQYILIESLHHRAQCAVAMAADDNLKVAARTRLLRSAERDARRIEGERMPWGDALAQLVRAGIAATRGNVEQAVARLSSAEAAFDAAGMALFAAASRRRYGALVGGDEGHALIATADAWMMSQQIKNPRKMTEMLAPGKWAGS
ncbi:MAG: protein kinase [Acidobacteria bacterium]|nr:protein kinase [Acidobacteriota bacterium]